MLELLELCEFEAARSLLTDSAIFVKLANTQPQRHLRLRRLCARGEMLTDEELYGSETGGGKEERRNYLAQGTHPIVQACDDTE